MYIQTDYDAEWLQEGEYHCEVIVGRDGKSKTYRNCDFVTIYIGRRPSGKRYYPVGRIHMSPKEAHELAAALELNARAAAGIFERKQKEIK